MSDMNEMVPLDRLRIGRLRDAVKGSFGRSLTTPEEGFFVGSAGEADVFVRYGQGRRPDGFYSDLAEGDLAVAGIVDVRFKGEWKSARPLNYLDQSNGALVLRGGVISICAALGAGFEMAWLACPLLRSHGRE